jgi:hypothetical protein
MSSVQTGVPTEITTPLSATVTGLASSGGLIEVTTSAPHLFGNGDTVQIFVSAGVGWGSQWPIVVIDSTHFTLTGSTFSATGTGTVEDLSLTPQIQVPTDGDTFSMQLSGMLSGLRGILSRTQYLNQYATGLNEAVETAVFPARNWHGVLNFSPSGITNGPCQVAWNDTQYSIGGTSTQLWLLLGYNGGSSIWELYVNDGTGDALQGPFPSAGVSYAQSPTDVLVVPPSGDVFVAGWNGGVVAMWHTTGSAGNLSSFTQVITEGVTNASDAKLAFVAGQIVTAVGSTTSGAALLATVTLIGSFTNIVPGITATTWILVGETNGGSPTAAMALAIAAQALASPNIYTTSNGTSWTTTSLSSVLSSTDVPVGICYLTILRLWYMAVKASTTSFRIMSSPDGVTWYKIGGTHTTGTVTSISYSGNYLVATLYRSTLFSGDPTWQMIYSLDGITWYGTNTYLLQGALVTPRLSASPTQLCVFGLNTPAGGGTLNYRFSHEGSNDANGPIT